MTGDVQCSGSLRQVLLYQCVTSILQILFPGIKNNLADRQIELLVKDNSQKASAVWAYKLKINWSGSKIY